MQNRLATAMIMAAAGALDHVQQEGHITDEAANHFMMKVDEYVQALLKGEVVNTDGRYPMMKLSGDNEVARDYNDVVAFYGKIGDPDISQLQGGYRE